VQHLAQFEKKIALVILRANFASNIQSICTYFILHNPVLVARNPQFDSFHY